MKVASLVKGMLRFGSELGLLGYSIVLAALGQAHRIPRTIREKVTVISWSLEQFVAWAARQVPPGAAVLDAGAGQCQYKPFWAHTRYVAVDFGRGDVAWDFSLLDCLASLEYLPFQAERFDAILCTEVLEHLPEPRAALKEFHRVLNPRGHLFLTVPMAWELHQKPYDYYRFTSFGLRYLLSSAGFAVLSLEARGGYFWYMGDKLTMVGKILFHHGPRHLLFRTALLPLRAAIVAMTTYLLPYCLFYLDRFDKNKDLTIGYSCHAVKGVPSATGVFEQGAERGRDQ